MFSSRSNITWEKTLIYDLDHLWEQYISRCSMSNHISSILNAMRYKLVFIITELCLEVSLLTQREMYETSSAVVPTTS